MNAFDLLLVQWSEQVKELFPHLHAYQQQSLAFCVQGILRSGNAVLQRVAEVVWDQTESETKMVSHERRMQRFVANERIVVEDCWKVFLEHILPFWQNKAVKLILDLTPYTQESTIVYLGLLVQSRALPIAWCVMPQHEQWEEPQWQIVGDMFDLVAPLLSTSDCTLLADRGLSCRTLIHLCEKAKWHYVLRIKNEEWFRKQFRQTYRPWQQGESFKQKQTYQWYGKVLLWKEHEFATWLSIYWEPQYEETWFLISDRPASHKRVSEYQLRMRVESTFQDQKSRGCFIECSRFTNREHLHRWLFAVHLAMWWTAHLATSCIHHGKREQVDRKDRRDKGLLRIGRLWFKALLKKANRDLRSRTCSQVPAQLANCLPFFHREKRLCFSIYLR